MRCLRKLPATILGCSVLSGQASFAQQSQELPGITVTTPKKAAAPKAPKQAAHPTGATDLSQSDGGAVPTIGPSANNVGTARSGSSGYVSSVDIEAQPVFRVGEMLEVVPGIVVTQHSGEGKANQYFLRGFNLDHGTDLAITFDGMPVNMRTHGHGQGYADTNFIIPEIMVGLLYRKGPYFAAEGDFASAGAIYLDAVDRLPRNFAQVELGSFGHQRAVTAMSVPVGVTGNMLVAAEVVRFDGPWERPDDLRKLNGFLRYSNGSVDNGFALTAMAYSGKWFATDQVPQRAVDSGLIGRYGNLDPTDGGISDRFSVSARWSERDKDSATRINAYVIKSDLALFNNFTFFLDDPANGDQFKQIDRRVIVGANAAKTLFGDMGGMKTETTFGVQSRYDSINVGLFKTFERTVLSTVREDDVKEFSIGLFGEQLVRWTPWLRTSIGGRVDLYNASVASNLAANSGSDFQGIVSPKFGLVLGPWQRTEFYLNAGTGFHSNDARGTVTTVDPGSGLPTQPTPFLVRSKGAEIGLRTQPAKGITSTLAGFILDFDSEIVFVGDAGTTEASRPSRRLGIEYTLHAQLLSWLALDLSAAYTRARFTEDDPAAPGRFIPGATEGVVSAALNFNNLWGGWFGGINVRYFGPRPLIEDNSVRSASRSPVSARIGYAFADGLTVRLDAYNIFDEQSHQIDYFYASRLAGEPSAVDDIHFHPTEPRSFRMVVRKEF